MACIVGRARERDEPRAARTLLRAGAVADDPGACELVRSVPQIRNGSGTVPSTSAKPYSAASAPTA